MEGGSGNAGGASWTESEHSAALDSLVAAIENFTIEHHGSGQPDAPFDESYLANLSLAQIRCYIAALNESQAYLLGSLKLYFYTFVFRGRGTPQQNLGWHNKPIQG